MSEVALWCIYGVSMLCLSVSIGIIVPCICMNVDVTIKEAKRMFGKKSKDMHRIPITVSPCATVSMIERLDELMKKEAVRLGVIEDTITRNLSEGQFVDSLVECEECGCLLRKGTAVRGDSVIEIKDPASYGAYIDKFWACVDPEESIREVYYCKKHQPKVKK